MKFELTDYEADKKQIIEAPGVAEAMQEYLPWQTLKIMVYRRPDTMEYEVTDLHTDFMYRMRKI